MAVGVNVASGGANSWIQRPWWGRCRHTELMGVERNESVTQWSERAIVAHSVAVAHEESLADAGNPTAKRAARKRAEEVSADLDQALDALRAERRQPE